MWRAGGRYPLGVRMAPGRSSQHFLWKVRGDHRKEQDAQSGPILSVVQSACRLSATACRQQIPDQLPPRTVARGEFGTVEYEDRRVLRERTGRGARVRREGLL